VIKELTGGKNWSILTTMNREIKFRVWDEKYNVWDVSPIMFYPAETVLKQGRVIQQFTGLKDKNGKEIYEGDILRISRDIVDKVRIVDTESHVCEVYYETDGFWLKGRFHHRHITDWDTVAIGNIFENPELCAK